MDFLAESRKVIEQFEDGPLKLGFNFALTHVEVAQSHFDTARSSGVDYYYSDVIYRSNQAYEGLLKTAYNHLNSGSSGNTSTFQIETYIKDSSRISGRVIDLLNNYRREWRNPSTHDHTLEFRFDEAAMALSSVSVFSYIFINEIHKDILRALITSSATGKHNESESIFDIIRSFNSGLTGIEPGEVIREIELVSALGEFIRERVSEPKSVSVEPLIDFDGLRLRPDIIVNAADKSYIIECKNIGVGNRIHLKEAGSRQVARYMSIINRAEGILYLPKIGAALELEETEYDHRKITILS